MAACRFLKILKSPKQRLLSFILDLACGDCRALPGDQCVGMGDLSIDLFNGTVTVKIRFNGNTMLYLLHGIMILQAACVVAICLNTLHPNKSYFSTLCFIP